MNTRPSEVQGDSSTDTARTSCHDGALAPQVLAVAERLRLKLSRGLVKKLLDGILQPRGLGRADLVLLKGLITQR